EDGLKQWGVPQGKGGRIAGDEHFRVRGFENVFAVGDVGGNPDNPLPQLAQPAIQGGKHAGKFIKAELTGKTVKPFKYRDKGTMATIGRSSAVDRKSTRLNSSHVSISYAVFCLKKKRKRQRQRTHQ